MDYLKYVNIAIHMYSFHSLKLTDLRTGIDFERLITNHIIICGSYKRQRRAAERHVLVHVFFFSVVLRLSPGLCTLGKCS